jgi:hypothetical protein
LKIENGELKMEGTQMTQMKQINADFYGFAVTGKTRHATSLQKRVIAPPQRVIAGLTRNPLTAGDTGIRRYDGAIANPRSKFVSIRVIRGQKKQT